MLSVSTISGETLNNDPCDCPERQRLNFLSLPKVKVQKEKLGVPGIPFLCFSENGSLVLLSLYDLNPLPR